MVKRMWHKKTGEPKVFGNDETPSSDYIDHHPNDSRFTTTADDKSKADEKAKAAAAKAKAEADAKAKAHEEAKAKAAEDEAKAKEEKPALMPREDLILALNEGKIPFDDSADDETLDKVLNESLVQAFASLELTVADDDTTQSLLDKLHKHMETASKE